ncbi:hypothetical protein PRIPAC_84337 [Pristionchus pacificus]|uniref:Uncharacterized protein n=1 Tax=Pristionchus pacificus TaxID=54126 RepID=A0A2A6BU05_PRIPA|nr:hypothetical protein PRIPAC_84337 [Pristionchus pacificus]|eukprot:PDM69462.1 hypothetical protein PRIPAC_44558 [Pristionchus pacificus]
MGAMNDMKKKTATHLRLSLLLFSTHMRVLCAQTVTKRSAMEYPRPIFRARQLDHEEVLQRHVGIGCFEHEVTSAYLHFNNESAVESTEKCDQEHKTGTDSQHHELCLLRVLNAHSIFSGCGKFPAKVLARNPEQFGVKYKKEVMDWLEKHGFRGVSNLVQRDYSSCNYTESVVEKFDE